MSDGLQTVALVNQDGLLVDVVDVHDWAKPFADDPLPVPCASRYRTHGQATLCGGHLCLVLTPNGEIKVFAEGVQAFSFLDGRWRLTDAAEKYQAWLGAVGDRELGERLFAVALNLAEDRRGGLFLVLDDSHMVDRLVSPDDLLEAPAPAPADALRPALKTQLHYLLRQKRVPALAPTVLETLARIDGAVVLDRAGALLSFGAILRHPMTVDGHDPASEGGRSTAAVAASRFGSVLKISEDGLVSFFQNGHCMWEL